MTQADPTARLRTTSISKSYGGITVLSDCSIHVAPHEVVALVGHNGAGKSTLSKIISGYESPDGGLVELDGDEYSVGSPHEALARGIALVPQQLAVIPVMTVEQNLVLGLRSRPDNAAEVARQLGLEGLMKTRLDRIGPAAQRLVMIGRSLVRKPRLLILDEPTAAFSIAETEALFTIIRRLAADGLGVIYVSHRLAEILEVADRVIGMAQGRVIADVSTKGTTTSDLADIIAGGAIAHGTESDDEVSYVAPEADVAPGKEVLRLTGVSTTHKIKSASLVVRAGEVVGLTGLVGAGRSSLVNALWGVGETVTGGTVKICAEPYRPTTPRKSIARGMVLIPEDRARTSVIPGMTVRENVALATSRTRRVRPTPLLAVRRERTEVASLLRDLDTQPDNAVDMPIHSLSGGNQQKAVLARWLMVPAEVVVLDEPCEGVDVRARREIHSVLRGLAERGRGVLVSSSDVEELVESTDRILIMRDGEIVDEMSGSRKTVEAVNRACLQTSQPIQYLQVPERK